MKRLSIISLLLSSLFLLGCATSGGSEPVASDESAAMEGSADVPTGKTAYEGATGAGLLMERYKSGQIEGYRD